MLYRNRNPSLGNCKGGEAKYEAFVFCIGSPARVISESGPCCWHVGTFVAYKINDDVDSRAYKEIKAQRHTPIIETLASISEGALEYMSTQLRMMRNCCSWQVVGPGMYIKENPSPVSGCSGNHV